MWSENLFLALWWHLGHRPIGPYAVTSKAVGGIRTDRCLQHYLFPLAFKLLETSGHFIKRFKPINPFVNADKKAYLSIVSKAELQTRPLESDAAWVITSRPGASIEPPTTAVIASKRKVEEVFAAFSHSDRMEKL